MEEEIVVIEDNNIEEINIEEENYSGKPYELPIASKDTLGGIKVGQNLTIDEDGTLNAVVPTKVSDLENDKGFISKVPEEYITETELNEKGYLTEHQDISNLATKNELPTKTSQLENDSNFINSIKTINGQSLIGEGDIVIEGGGGTGSGGSLEIERITIPSNSGLNEDNPDWVSANFIEVQKCGNICMLNLDGGDGIQLLNGTIKTIAILPEGYRPIKNLGGWIYVMSDNWTNTKQARITVYTTGEVRLIQRTETKMKISQVLGQFAYYVDEPMPIVGENVDISKYATIEDMENTINEAIGVALEGEY